MSIAENIAAIRSRIDAAARETGRTGADITLVGASKMNDAVACREAIAAGIDVLGENRVQEMTAKLSQNAYDGAPLHFIGHLQRNKVRQVVGKVALIESVGSEALLREIEKEAAKQGIVQDILLEINIGGEEAKSGFAPDEVFAAAELAKTLAHVRVRGVMTIPPADADREENIITQIAVMNFDIEHAGNMVSSSTGIRSSRSASPKHSVLTRPIASSQAQLIPGNLFRISCMFIPSPHPALSRIP